MAKKKNKARTPKSIEIKNATIIKGVQRVDKVCKDFKIPFEILQGFLKSKGRTITNSNSELDAISMALITKHFTVPMEEEKTHKGKPRLLAVCNAYNISKETLINFLNEKGIKDLSSHSIIDESIIKLIEDEFYKDKNALNRIKAKIEFQFSDIVNESQPVSFREPLLFVKKDLFKEIKQEIFCGDLPSIMSYFSDQEAKNICCKMTSSYPRNLCKKVEKDTNNEYLIYQIHFIANKALNIFGGKVLTFIHQLRKMNFVNGNSAKEIRTYSRIIPDFPILTLTTGMNTFKVSFFVKQKKDQTIISDIRLFSKNNQEIGTLDSDGNIISRLENFRPQLRLFYNESQENTITVFSGIESGKCEVCGKELIDPTSLRIGLGPVCAKSYKLDKGLYQLPD